MTLKNRVRELVEKQLGLRIFNEKYLPLGISLEVDLWKFNSNEFEIVFDVGANVGQTASEFVQYFPSAEIHCFEPISKPFEILRNNFESNHRVHCYHQALGAENGELNIVINDDPISTTNSLIHQGRHSQNKAKHETVEVISIDSFLVKHNIPRIDFLKIDVEGFELEVLKGAANAFDYNQVRLVLCEVGLSAENKFHVSIAEMIAFMEAKGFYFFGLYQTALVKVENGRMHSNALFVLKKDLFQI